MIIKIVITLILVLFLCFFIFRDNSLKRNINMLWSLGIIAVCSVLIVLLAMNIIKSMRGAGEGPLFTQAVASDNADTGATEASDENIDIPSDSESEPLGIRVHGDTYITGKEEYRDVDLLRPVITEAVSQNRRLIITDDYASANAYLTLFDLLDELGAEDFSEETVD